MISIITAMSSNRVIWLNNSLPWSVPDDLKNFKKLTDWKTIVMWYNTYLSIWRPLPNRNNIVLTRKDIVIPWCEIYNSIFSLLDNINSKEEIFVIWWEQIYKQFIDTWLIDKIYLSFIPWEYEWDTFFPDFENDYNLISEEQMNWFLFRIYEKF